MILALLVEICTYYFSCGVQALSSFCPTSGGLKRVDVFLSDFGRARLEEEERLGPAELRRWKEQQDGQDQEGEDFLDLAKSTKKVPNRTFRSPS